MADPVSARLDISLDAPFEARRLVAQTLADHPRLDDAMLATSELVTNAVRHSGAPQAVLSIEVQDHRLRVAVEHDGRGFLPAAPTDPSTGRGLAILQAVVDRWGIEGGPTTVVWFELGHPNS